MASKALGRGLSALIQDADTLSTPREKRDTSVLMVPVGNILPNPKQPRKIINQEALKDLAQSIRNEGIIQPLLVRKSSIAGHYDLVAGERRWRAAQLAELNEVPVYVKDMSDHDVMVAMLIENIQREDLNPAETAYALRDLKEKLNLTQEDLSTKIGMSRSFVANSLRLLNLPKEALDSLHKGDITAGHARCLLALADNEQATQSLLAHMLDGKLSVRDCEDAIALWKQEGHLPWDDAAEETIVKEKVHREPRKSRDFKRTEKNLTKILGCKAKFNGTPDQGKLSIAYANREELAHILAQLGMTDPLPEA